MQDRKGLLGLCFILLYINLQAISGTIQPTGSNLGLLQFDAVIELTHVRHRANWVVFARYWVCRDYYCLAVVWSEPRGSGMMDLKTLIVLSDKNNFKIDNQRYAFWKPTNTTYPKPIGPRPPFAYGGGPCEISEMRFAEAHALARRVYVRDLEQGLKDQADGSSSWYDLKISRGAGTSGDLAVARVLMAGARIDQMELFDANKLPLAKLSYEYAKGHDQGIARLTAELPQRPIKIKTGDQALTVTEANATKTYHLPDVDYVRHKGGRICTVEYKDVVLGDRLARLPVSIQVRSATDRRFIRSARLMNFKLVDMDRTKVWEAARAFAGLSDQDKRLDEMARFLPSDLPRWKVRGVKVDPNDMAFVNALIAKYPVPEISRSSPLPPETSPPSPPRPHSDFNSTEEYRQYLQQRHQEDRSRRDLEKERMDRYHQELAPRPLPPRLLIEPNDLRAIRALIAHYNRIIFGPLQEKGEPYAGQMPKELYPISELAGKLHRILSYHREPELPEDAPPVPSTEELRAIKQLRDHYVDIAASDEKALGERLKALCAMTQLDTVLRDWEALGKHSRQYMELLTSAGLSKVCMDTGNRTIDGVVKAGQYDLADALLTAWLARSLADNEPNEILRFARVQVRYSSSCWTVQKLMEGLLKKPGLTPTQRYEALAIRAIALHRAERLILEVDDRSAGKPKGLAGWILRTTSRQRITPMVSQAVSQAVAAWHQLGPDKLTVARPYTLDGVSPTFRNFSELPDPTPLQEISAMLDQIVRQRSAQGSQAQPTQVQPERPTPRQPQRQPITRPPRR